MTVSLYIIIDVWQHDFSLAVEKQTRLRRPGHGKKRATETAVERRPRVGFTDALLMVAGIA